MSGPHRGRRGRWAAPAVVLLTAFGLGGCAASAGPEPANRNAYRELLRAQRERQAAVPAKKTAPPTVAEKLRQGDASREAGQAGRAMWSYLQAHRLDREAPEPVARIASLHLKEDPQRARELFAMLATRHPESVDAHTGLGLAELARGELEDARASLTRAAELHDDPTVLSALGVTLDRLGEHRRAQEYYRRAAELDPASWEIQNNLGVSLLMSKDYAPASEALRKAALLRPRDPAVLNNLGLVLGRLERYDEALDSFRKAGGEQAARNNLGYVYFLNGRYFEAVTQYESALILGGKEDRVQILRNLRAAREAAASSR